MVDSLSPLQLRQGGQGDLHSSEQFASWGELKTLGVCGLYFVHPCIPAAHSLSRWNMVDERVILLFGKGFIVFIVIYSIALGKLFESKSMCQVKGPNETGFKCMDEIFVKLCSHSGFSDWRAASSPRDQGCLVFRARFWVNLKASVLC